MSKEFKVKFKTRNINSKRLFKDIRVVAEEVCNEYISHSSSMLDDTFDYKELVTFFEMFMEDLIEKKKITQYDILADHRNNDPVNVSQGVIHLTVKFRQTNCLNVSQVDMEFVAE